MYKPYHYQDWWSKEPKKATPKSNDTSRTARATRGCAPAGVDDWLALVHPLRLCPPIAMGDRYVLVERKWWGQRDVLGMGRARSPHDSVNLARVRHRAARLGATEVHILPH